MVEGENSIEGSFYALVAAKTSSYQILGNVLLSIVYFCINLYFRNGCFKNINARFWLTQATMYLCIYDLCIQIIFYKFSSDNYNYFYLQGL